MATRDLLRSLHDYLPVPRGALQSTSGLPDAKDAQRWTLCTACRGEGWALESAGAVTPCPHPGNHERHKCHVCPVCDGRGQRRRRQGDKPYDPYVGELTGERGETRAKTLRELDADIARIDAVLAEHEGGFDVRAAFGWEREKRYYWKNGSYRELELAIRWLYERDEGLGRIVWRIEVSAEPVELSPGLQELLWGAVEMLATKMPDPIQVPWWVQEGTRKQSLWNGKRAEHRQLREVRDLEIRTLLEREDWTVEQIGERYGLTPQWVRKIRREPVPA